MLFCSTRPINWLLFRLDLLNYWTVNILLNINYTTAIICKTGTKNNRLLLFLLSVLKALCLFADPPVIDFIFFLQVNREEGTVGPSPSCRRIKQVGYPTWYTVPRYCLVLWILIRSRFIWVSGSEKAEMAPPKENGE